MSRPAAIGVDAGSTTWKGVVLSETGSVLASKVAPAHPLIAEQTQEALGLLREEAGAGTEVPVGATGYGRKRVQAARIVTEITCHARGAFHRVGRPGVLIDMGGQDTKVIRVGAGGAVADFAMNDKCAAGTGRFLEVLLRRLDVPYDRVATLVAEAGKAVQVSSTCTVFAESEVISLVSEGAPLAGILRGVHEALALRIVALGGGLQQVSPVFMSGGVALNAAMVTTLSRAMGRAVEVVPEPQLVGAIGAALTVL
ncbi:acyl-CoA dehydratase activase [Planctomycetota bacterium]